MQLRRSLALIGRSPRPVPRRPHLVRLRPGDRPALHARRGHQRPRRRRRRALGRGRRGAAQRGHLRRHPGQQLQPDDAVARPACPVADLEVARLRPDRASPRATASTSPTTAAILVTGDFDAGRLSSRSPSPSTTATPPTLNVPVVTACDAYLGLDLTEDSEFIPYACESTSREPAARARRAGPRRASDPHAGPAPPRRERVERQEPVHRLGRRPADATRAAPRPSTAAGCWPRPVCCPTSCTPRCCAARSPPPRSRSTPPTGTGSRCAATGASTSGTTAPSRARTRSRPSSSTARSSSCSGAARSTSRRRRSRTTPSSPRPASRSTPTSAPRCRAPSASRTSSTGSCPTGSPASSPTCAPAQTVLVAAHGNSLRALVKHLDGISDEDIAGLNIPTGMPLVYELDDSLAPHRPRWPLPRPRRRRGRGRRRRQPGPLTAACNRAFWCSGRTRSDAGGRAPNTRLHAVRGRHPQIRDRRRV